MNLIDLLNVELYCQSQDVQPGLGAILAQAISAQTRLTLSECGVDVFGVLGVFDGAVGSVIGGVEWQ